MSADLIREIRGEIPHIEILENEPMSRHCSFRIGGPARALILPKGVDEIAGICRLLAKLQVQPLIIGNGTNLLFTDSPIERIILKLGGAFSEIEGHGAVITAQSGMSLARLSNFAAERGLTGLEFAHGIPGTLGGAVAMNAGAYGGEMKDVVSRTLYLGEDMELSHLNGDQHGFSYRHSFFSDSRRVILSCEILLEEGDSEEIQGKMRELAVRRRESQPLDAHSAGSTFKRPANGYAAQMIDEAGLRGYAAGGAMVSEKHAGFIVNSGGASFDDVMRVIDHVREIVFKVFGVMLELEVKIIK